MSYDLFIFALNKIEYYGTTSQLYPSYRNSWTLGERFNIGWDLRPDVNILSGINGVGKTTILNRSVGYLEELSGEMKSDEKNGVRLFFDNPQATYIPYDVIRSYDRPLIMGDFTARMADKNVKSELDWQLYLLQRRYLDYQVNIGNKMIEMLSSDNEEERRKGGHTVCG